MEQEQPYALVLTENEEERLSILDGVVFEAEAQQWLDWIEAYHAWLEAKRRKSGAGNTVSTYSSAWKQFFRWAQVKPWEVTARLAQNWAGWLAYSGKEIKDRFNGTVVRREGLAAASINLKLAAMSSFYSFVQRNYDGLWPADKRNPFASVERNKVSPYGRAKYPTVEEAKAMLAACNPESLVGRRDFALLFTFMVTCRRSSEILNMRWGDLQSMKDGDYAFEYRYKGGEQKKAVLSAACFQAIRGYLEAAGRWGEMNDEDYIFTAIEPGRAARLPHIEAETVETNRPLTNSMANKILKKYARRAGVEQEKAHIHGLRHAGARLRVQLMREGKGAVDFEEIMNLLGHSSLAVTQIYATTILTDPEDRGAQAAAEALIPKGRKRRRQKPAAEQKALF